jgi:hypothetical protein
MADIKKYGMHQGVSQRKSAVYMRVCEHFKEAHDAPWFNKIDANPASRGNTAIGR